MLAKDYPIALGCSVIGLARSAYYYEAVEADEVAVKQAVEEIAAQFPTYGSRRITAQLRRAPYTLTLNRQAHSALDARAWLGTAEDAVR